MHRSDQSSSLVKGWSMELGAVMELPKTSPYPFSTVLAGHIAIAAIALAGLVWASMTPFTLSERALVWALTALFVPVLASEGVRRSSPIVVMGLANRITLFRGLLIGWIAAFCTSAGSDDQMLWVAGVASLALILDGLDGLVARATHGESAYGAQLDMEFDALLMLILSWLAVQWGQAGAWVLFCGLARYVWIAVQMAVPWFRRSLPESFRRKTACVVGIVGLIMTVAPLPWSVLWAATATATLGISFWIDAAWLVRLRKEPMPGAPGGP